VEAFAALLIGGSSPRLEVVHAAKGSDPRTPGARPIPPLRAERSLELRGAEGQASPIYGVGGVPGKIWPWNGSSSVPVETWK